MGNLHCLKVGCGDASVIATASGTFLVDCHRIGEFAHLLPSSKLLRGVFVTHQHEDHFSGLHYLWDNRFNIGHLVFSPYDRRYNDASVTIEEWSAFNWLKTQFAQRGTKLHAPYRQQDFQKGWWQIDGIKFE